MSLGQWGEQLAQAEYKKQGYQVIAAHVFNRRGKQVGEIDFIALSNRVIVFVEVKTRSAPDGQFGGALAAVDVGKQQRLVKAAKLYLVRHPEHRSLRPQIDVCVVLASDLDNSQPSVTIFSNAVEDLY
jgi:putative endonuclease